MCAWPLSGGVGADELAEGVGECLGCIVAIGGGDVRRVGGGYGCAAARWCDLKKEACQPKSPSTPPRTYTALMLVG